jgi:uncharacterized protein
MMANQPYAFILVCLNAALFPFSSQAQRNVITSYYPAFDSVGMRVPVELQFEVLAEDSTIKDGYWVKFSQEGDTLLFCRYQNNLLHGVREEHYGDGHIKSRIPYENGQRKGLAYFWEFNRELSYTERYTSTTDSTMVLTTRINKDGHTIALGYLKNDLADSTWKEFYPDQKLKSIATFKQGKLNGWVETFYPDGKLLQKAAFKDQALEGKVLLYYPEGVLKSECQYERGAQNGLLIEYYNDGIMKTKSTYKNNTLNGLTQRYYPNGTLATEENYLNGVLFGFFKTYFDNGQQESASTLEAGKKQGRYMEYNRKGILILETGYTSGALHGENKAYDDEGKLLHKLNYKDGIKTGKNYYYYPSGPVKEVQDFEYGKEVNLVAVKRYFENEQTQEAGSYIIQDPQDPKGWVKEGEWLGFYPNGKMKYKEQYLKGKKQLMQVYYHENGTLQSEEHYTLNLKQGRWLRYFEDGKMEMETHYKNNQLFGPYKVYYPSGSLKLSGHYTGGKKTGDWKYLDLKGTLEKSEHYKNDILIKTKVMH